MKIDIKHIIGIGLLGCCLACSHDDDVEKAIEFRDPLLQPFHETSIWNMPIGSDAVYVHAKLEPPTAYGMTADEDILILTPDEPLMDVYLNKVQWGKGDRYEIQGDVLFSVPIPASFLTPDEGGTPNAGAAILLPDRRTLLQTQPLTKLGPEYATSGSSGNYLDIYGEGRAGAHGGTGLSAIGGTLRIHELTPTSGPIKHVMKINLFVKKNIYYDAATKGYRWPAYKGDGLVAQPGSLRTTEPVPACREGALLALPPWVNIEEMGLQTEPAKILAQAFMDYGAYVVDDTAWDVLSMATELSPQGRFTKIFEKNWGFPFVDPDLNSPWNQDMIKIHSMLHVVDNNTAMTKGGGGTPRVPLSAPLKPFTK